MLVCFYFRNIFDRTFSEIFQLLINQLNFEQKRVMNPVCKTEFR